MLYPLSYEGLPGRTGRTAIFSCREPPSRIDRWAALEAVEPPWAHAAHTQEETAAASRPRVSSSSLSLTSGKETFSRTAWSVTLLQS